MFIRFVTLLVLFGAVNIAWGQQVPTSQDYMQNAQQALQDNDTTSAIEDYLLAIKVQPNNWQAYQNLGGCYIQLRKMDDAKAAYIQSLKYNPNNPALIKFMAQIWGGSQTPTATIPAPVATPTATNTIFIPVASTPTATPNFYSTVVSTATPVWTATSTPVYVYTVVNTATPLVTSTNTPVGVVVPFIDISAFSTPTLPGVPTRVPFKGFKPYVYQALPRYNLPEKDTLALDVGLAAWWGGAQNFSDYFGANNYSPNVTAQTGWEADLGLDYALLNEFQLGVHLEGIISPVQKSELSSNGEFIEWDSYALGAALSGKYMIPLNSAMSLVLHAEGGYYTLVGSSIKYDDGNMGNIGLSGSALGELIAAEMEFFQVADKSLALDFGLGYRFLNFNNLTGSGTYNGTIYSGPVKNANGSPAYIDFSGPRVSLSIRFIH